MPDPSQTTLVIAPFPPPYTGLSVYAPYLVRLLSGRGEVISVRLPSRQPDSGPSGFSAKLFASLLAAFCVMTGPRYSSAVLALDGGVGLYLNLLIVVALRLRGIKVGFSHHSFAYVDASSLPMHLIQRLSPNGSLNVFLCESMVSAFHLRYGTRFSSLVLSNAGRVCQELSGLTLEQERSSEPGLTLGFLGNITAEKGIFEFIELVEALQPLGSFAGLIAGPASAEMTIELEKRLRDKTEIRWLGPVYGEQKAEFFRSIDFLVFPTKYKNEAEPNVILEALAFGVPVVALTRGCISHDVGRAGFSFSDPTTFVSEARICISLLSKSPKEAARLKSLARSRYSELLQQATLSEEALMTWCFS